MSLKVKIEENYQTFTVQEKKIADFLTENLEVFKTSSVQVLGKETNTSPAAIIRFAKKLKYDSLNQMRFDIPDKKIENKDNIQLIVKENDSMHQVVDVISNLYGNTIDKIIEMINYDSLDIIIKKLRGSDRIFLFGVGASALVALDFQEKLLRINKNCIFHLDSHVQVAYAANITEKDTVVAFTYSGETKEVSISLRYAKTKGAFCVLVTKPSKNLVYKIADQICLLPNVESESQKIRMSAILSRVAELFFADLFFIGIAQEDFKKMKNHLVETKNLTDLLKEE